MPGPKDQNVSDDVIDTLIRWLQRNKSDSDWDKRSAVRWLQRSLFDLQIIVREEDITGIYDMSTKGAVETFQRVNDIGYGGYPYGEVDEETLNLLQERLNAM